MSSPRTVVIATAELTTNFISMLSTALDRPVGDHALPPDARMEDGYAIAYRIPGGEFNGPPLWTPESDARLLFQVTSVAGLRGQCEWISDRVRLTVCSRKHQGGFQVPFPNPAGWNVYHREPETVPPGVTPQGTEPNVVFNVHERFYLSVEPT